MSTQPTASAIDTGIQDAVQLGEEATATLREKAGQLRERASELLHEGMERAKANPYAAAAVVGGVAVTAAAAAYGGVKLSQRHAAKADAHADAIDPASIPEAIQPTSF